MSSRFSRSSLIAAVLLAPLGALAGPVTINFTVTGGSAWVGDSSVTQYDGYALGASGSGSFTFDDSIGSFSDAVAGRAVSNFGFSWLGEAWADGSALLNRMTFDSSGNILNWGLGSPIGCGINCVWNPGPTDFWIDGYAPGGAQGSLALQHNSDASGYMLGRVSWTAVRSAVPEPGTLGLLALGLAGIAALGRRRAAAAAN